ncbi:MAG: hypothetical protein K8J08_03270 [Thermoanaerobaculia bacterium]|nr:hypothetical protein [Thermoanaerobaculia bacterium]
MRTGILLLDRESGRSTACLRIPAWCEADEGSDIDFLTCLEAAPEIVANKI